jgi:hypothetical protein
VKMNRVKNLYISLWEGGGSAWKGLNNKAD